MVEFGGNGFHAKTSLLQDTGFTCKTCKCVAEYSLMEEENNRFRPYMEDTNICKHDFGGKPNEGFFAVFDGHGGKDASEHCAERMADEFDKILTYDIELTIEEALETLFKKIDSELRMLDAENAGTTACVVYLCSEGTQKVLYIANVGDTRAVISAHGVAERLTIDHRCSDIEELDRIKKTGGLVIGNRVGGQLALTRSLGDHSLRGHGVIAEPYIRKYILGPSNQLLILATDGVWDTLSDQEALDLIEGISSTNEMAKKIIKESLNEGSKDNLTCLVIKL